MSTYSPCTSACTDPHCANDNAAVLEGIHFTRSDLEKTVKEAMHFHGYFLQSTRAEKTGGLQSLVTPDWAPKLVRRHGVVQAVIDKLGSNAFAKRKPENNAGHVAYVEKAYAKQSPLVFRIAVGPIKNIRCCGNAQQPDIAEYLSIIQLARVMAAIAALYPFGVKVEMVPDNMRAMIANRCPECYVHCYVAGLQKLVRHLKFENWLDVIGNQKELYDRYATADYWMQAESNLKDWKQNDPEAFHKKWQMACDNAERNLYAEHDLQEKDIHDSAWRYLIAHQSEILSGMWSTDHIFPLMNANHPNNYQMYTLAAKQTKLPWQISLPASLLPEFAQQLPL